MDSVDRSAADKVIRAKGARHYATNSAASGKGTRYPKSQAAADMLTGGRTSGHTLTKVRARAGSRLAEFLGRK